MKIMKKFISMLCVALAFCLSVSAGVSADETEWNKVIIELAFTYGENISYYHLVSPDFKKSKDVLYIEALGENCRMFDLDNDGQQRKILDKEFEIFKNKPEENFFDRRCIEILGDITYIGNEAFVLNTRVKNVYIPDSVTEMGKNIFNKYSNPVIHCSNGSAAMNYALENNHAVDAEGYEAITGDVNCDNRVNMKDVLALRKYMVGRRTAIEVNSTDINADGKLNMKDVLKIRRMIAGIE